MSRALSNPNAAAELADIPAETLGAMERHYTVEEIARAWNLSPDTVRRIFEREPGVLVVENYRAYGKRRYRTLRIPAAVAERVHRRMLTKPMPSGRLRI